MADQTRTQPPVRIKLYGLFPVTRRGYLTQLGFAAVLLVALLVVWTCMPSIQAPEQLAESASAALFVWAVLRKLPWLVLGFAVLFTIEAWIVLRKFSRLQAQQKQ